jgi:hypothetical protein
LKKPTNWFSVVFWIVGAFYFVTKMIEIFVVSHPLLGVKMPATGAEQAMFATVERNLDSARTLVSIGSALLGTAQIVGFAIIIELVDKIRWNAQINKGV